MLETHTVQLQHKESQCFPKDYFFCVGCIKSQPGLHASCVLCSLDRALLLLHLPTQGW